ncbi:hypothetical protein HG537_0E04060 [Torulaspora globosa]|uniref:Uncharacterized protein n=1 Tax=Torulaspora globosa TaxID=48254 RepID=A0A7H9HUM9_9SACH|nr:hypothetical protein HG537_0E04060 [Torulaspora sp. CBS 2947]
MATNGQAECRAASRLFVRIAELNQWVHCDEQLRVPVRYRLLGQVSEIITTGESVELSISELAEFANDELRESIRAYVGERLYESRFIENVGDDREIPRAGCAVSVCLGVVLQRDGTRMLEVFDLHILKKREIERLRWFICSSNGNELIRC